jgi:hypothetical protein
MSAPHSSWACPRVSDVIHRSLALAVLLLVPARLGSRFTAAMFDREQLITGIGLTRCERLAPHIPEHVISARSVVAPDRLSIRLHSRFGTESVDSDLRPCFRHLDRMRA